MRRIPLSILTVLDEIPIGVCLISKKRRVVFINRALEVLTGFAKIDAAGLPCSHVLRFNNCFNNCPVNGANQQERCILEGDIINNEHQKVPVRASFAPLRDSVGNISGYIETFDDLRRVRNFDPERMTPFSFGRIIGRSPQMVKIFQSLPVIAQSDAPVLITGQTGTGKDLLAEAIHHASARAENPFIAFRCGAIPDFLVESELFGAEKGAFAGAENKPGKFRIAKNGTLYISEIGDLSPALQVRLLNYLDEKTFYPLGSSKSVAADVRIIAASSHNLSQMVKEGAFRIDLYFRLNAVTIHLPPLKERGEDLRLLIDHFLRARASLLNRSVPALSDSCLKKLLKYEYPGNVLELKHIVEYALSLSQGERIEIPDLPAYLLEDLSDLNALSSGAQKLLQASEESSANESLDWSAVERRMIIDALKKVNGRRSKAAQLLGWGRSTLWRKMKLYGFASESDQANEKSTSSA